MGEDQILDDGDDVLGAVQVRSTLIASASRVYSSTMLQSLSLRWSEVSSNMKSIAHT